MKLSSVPQGATAMTVPVYMTGASVSSVPQGATAMTVTVYMTGASEAVTRLQ